MNDNVIRGIGLLIAAAIAGLVLIVGAINDSDSGNVTAVASLVLLMGGALGLVLLAVGLLRGSQRSR